jgi:putative endonuclease
MSVRSERGRKARLAGRRGEILCALWLMARGYRIVGFRVRTTQAEIDLLARKGGVLAVVEIKRRRNLDEALAAVTWPQRERLQRAAEALAARRPELAGAAVRLDLIALAPGRMPRHVPDAWRGG